MTVGDFKTLYFVKSIYCLFYFHIIEHNPSLGYSPQQYIKFVNLSEADYGPLTQDTFLRSVCDVFFFLNV